MEISLIPSKIKPGLTRSEIFWICIGTTLLLLAVFAGLKIYNTHLEGQLLSIKEEIKAIDAKKDLKLEKEMKEKLSPLGKAKTLLDSHIRAKNIFDLLEKTTFADVQITDFTFDAKENRVTILAESFDPKALGMQTSIFRARPEIKKVEIGGISIEEEGLLFKFQFGLTLDESTLKYSTKIK